MPSVPSALRKVTALRSGVLSGKLGGVLLERNGGEDVDVMQYWEDEADEVRMDEGTLLPLWKFGTSMAGFKQVCFAELRDTPLHSTTICNDRLP